MWDPVANIKGATGNTGSAGAKGDKGDTGDAGSSGSKGDTGIQGIPGVKGDTGSPGTTGAKGDTGADGDAGQGVPTGGATGTILRKVSATNFNTAWVAPGSSSGVQAYDADLDALAALGVTNDSIIQGKAGAWTKRTIAQVISDFDSAQTVWQTADADLDAIAALGVTNDSFIQGKAGAWSKRTIAQVKIDLGIIDPPLFSGYGTAAQSIPNGAHTAVLLSTETVDTANGHNTTTNTSRYTPTVAGWYLCSGVVHFSLNANGSKNVNLRKNGTEIRGGSAWVGSQSPANNARIVSPVIAVQCNGTSDYIEMYAYQDSGSAILLETGAATSTLTVAYHRAL